MQKAFTVIIRKSRKELVAVCLELNISARGKDLAELEINMKNAIDDYMEFLREESLPASTMPVEELVEFLQDTAHESDAAAKSIFRALELNEVPVNV